MEKVTLAVAKFSPRGSRYTFRGEYCDRKTRFLSFRRFSSACLSVCLFVFLLLSFCLSSKCNMHCLVSHASPAVPASSLINLFSAQRLPHRGDFVEFDTCSFLLTLSRPDRHVHLIFLVYTSAFLIRGIVCCRNNSNRKTIELLNYRLLLKRCIILKSKF